MQTRKLLIIEKNLIAHSGHYWTQVGQLKKILPKHSTHLLAGDCYDESFGRADAKISSRDIFIGRQIARIRHGSMAEKFRAGMRLAKKAKVSDLRGSSLLQGLRATAKRLSLSSQDIIVIPTADIDELEAAVQFVRHRDCSTPIHLRFVHHLLGETKELMLEKRLAAVRPLLSAQIHLYSETIEMADFLAQKYNIEVQGGFFMPCSLPPEQPIHVREKQDLFRVGVLGMARKDKGSSRIGPILDSLSELEESPRGLKSKLPIVFAIQPDTPDIADSPYYGNITRRDGLELHPASAGPDSFRVLLTSCDLLLLPYDLSEYRVRGSGLIQDAVAAGIPIVHTRGMAMQSFLDHGNALSAETPQEFAEAILKVARDPTKFKQGTSTAQTYYAKLLRSSPFVPPLDI
ncbi:glycosyltransferase [Roseibium sp.]|uniref:glycosyltransferase n=1 Tax=Roseibium sp. TaxID=1936156 RepID=UPI003A977B49